MKKDYFKHNAKKIDNKGITLIALIVTIIVLLILAGVTIATLTGDNGILSQSQKAKSVNVYKSAEEQVKLATMAVKAEIVEKKAQSGTYNATDTESVNALKQIVVADLVSTGSGFEVADPVDGESGAKLIKIRYSNTALKKDGVAEGIPVENGYVNYIITVTAGDATLETNAVFENFETGNSGGGETPTDPPEEVIDNSGSLADGFVDDLGTRATIYLYANATAGTTITITMPDNTSKSITALDDNTNIESTDNYATYTVAKNGTYTFSVTDENTTTETKIKVENIEKFTSIETLASQQSLGYAGGDTKAYNYNGAAVPKGYYVDTKSTVANGLVITDDIDSEGYSTGNEWVWVPVNSDVGNADYYDTEKNANNEVTPTALAGATSVTYTKYSKLYSFNDKTRENYNTFHPYGTTEGTLSRPSTTSSPKYREIAILTDYTYGEKGNYNLVNNRTTGTAFSNVTDVATQYKNDYESMVASVDKYHGFYIGRYEVTENGEKPGVSLAGTISNTAWNWYALYNKCLTFGKKDSNNVQVTESSMMYGALWDATMQWLAKSNISVGYTGLTKSGYGNYKTEDVQVSNNKETNITTIKVKASGTSAKLQTGQTSYTGRKNIYDLSGNCADWTQEASSTDYRVLRGGDYYTNDANTTFSANRTYDTPPDDYADYSSRPQLYIK